MDKKKNTCLLEKFHCNTNVLGWKNERTMEFISWSLWSLKNLSADFLIFFRLSNDYFIASNGFKTEIIYLER